MRISHLTLRNWKNFRDVNVALPERVFLIGSNASGKSNLLDALRFLRDLTPKGIGFRRACENRGGVSIIRCLAARKHSEVEIGVTLSDGDKCLWKYEIAFTQDNNDDPLLTRENAWAFGSPADNPVLNRPDENDERDALRLTQTALEQIATNVGFREIAAFFDSITYLHLVPQILRGTDEFAMQSERFDAYGRRFLERIATVPEKTQKKRLELIRHVLNIALPQLQELALDRDEHGSPHLTGAFNNWRPNAGRLDEGQFSDGMLRLFGLLWVLQEGSGPLLLEEPELSLHPGVVSRLAGMIRRVQQSQKRQVFISTHSPELLSDECIGASEILMLLPGAEGTAIQTGADVPSVRTLIESGMRVGDVVMPHTEPEQAHQLNAV